MNYSTICLEQWRSVECKFSPLVTFLFPYFVLLIRLLFGAEFFILFFIFFIFLGVYVSVIGGADSRSLRREPFTNFIEEEFFDSNI